MSEKRTELRTVRFTKSELAAVEENARKNCMALATWLRRAALSRVFFGDSSKGKS